MNNFEFKLGQTLKHLVLNISGPVMAQSENLTGCKRYLIAYKDKNNKVIEDWYGEAELVLHKDAPAQFKKRVKEIPFEFALGSEATDRITGVKVILMIRARYSPGYNRYTSQLIKPKEEKDADHLLHFDENQLQTSGVGIMTERATEVKERSADRPAGPPRTEASN